MDRAWEGPPVVPPNQMVALQDQKVLLVQKNLVLALPALEKALDDQVDH